jgi:hypothetical protein
MNCQEFQNLAKERYTTEAKIREDAYLNEARLDFEKGFSELRKIFPGITKVSESDYKYINFCGDKFALNVWGGFSGIPKKYYLTPCGWFGCYYSEEISTVEQYGKFLLTKEAYHKQIEGQKRLIKNKSFLNKIFNKLFS